MIGHQAVGMAVPTEPIDHPTEVLQESVPILVIKEDVLTSVSSSRDMVQRVLKLDT